MVKKKWQLKFNFSKCYYLLHLGKPHEFDEYTIDGNVIKVCDLVKGLVDKLKFHNHTTVVTKKANRLVAIIRKMFQHFDKLTFINLQNLCIAVQEYGNIIWRPRYIQDQQEIEKVQRRETKLNRMPFRTIHMMID